MQYTWQLALVLVPVFIKHSVSCYIYYIHNHEGMFIVIPIVKVTECKVIQSLPVLLHGQ